MKKLECYVRPEKLEPIKKGLFELGIKGMSISDVKGIRLVGRAGEYCVEWIDKLKLEIIIKDNGQLNEIINCIIENAKTGKPGDGKIFVLPVENAIRIRTQEKGEDIL